MTLVVLKFRKTVTSVWYLLNYQWLKTKVTFLSLYYNDHLSSSYVADILMEPIFWFVDNFTGFLGPFFVVAVIGLTSSVVSLCLVIGLPYWFGKSLWTTVFLVIFGLWLLTNVLFHFYKGCTVHPGRPPEGVFIKEAVSICKKCIAPKPPRTHHCSVCNKCILKMDHHCPWLNNCVGFYNHRHFFLYMTYTTLGVLFIMIFGTQLFLERVWWHEEDLVGHSLTEIGEIVEDEDFPLEVPFPQWHRGALVYMAFITVGVFISLLCLIIWHARLITRGETSIESIINKAESKKCAKIGKDYVNPYDLGWRRNWKIFLGIDLFSFSEGLRRTLLPSSHKVSGDGLTWSSLFSEDNLLYIEKTE